MSSTDASDENRVRIICGPTGAGKSALAMRLARRYDVVVISADSRQIYRGFDLGTAKPSMEDRVAVQHRGVDVADPVERYSAARWADSARDWIREARAAGKTPVIVGGTGFYLRALTAPLFDAPVLDPERRAALERVFPSVSTESLRRWCTNLDPERAHLGRTQLIRSIETAMLAGERLSELQRTRARAPDIGARYLVVDPGARLAERIERRVDAMMADGWADEVAALARSVAHDAPAWKASGYGAIRDLIDGRVTVRHARERVIVETRQYAKRQRTWFRHQLGGADTTRIDPDDPSIETIMTDWWAGRRTDV